jgi:hypothetical protein
MVEYVAVDIAKKNCVLCAENENGMIDEFSHYPNTTSDANMTAKRLIAKYGECVGVVESTGNMWLKTYEAFERVLRDKDEARKSCKDQSDSRSKNQNR